MSKVCELIEKYKYLINCNKNFSCGKHKDICKAEDKGWEGYLKCLEESPDCNFSVNFGGMRMCKCPIRIHIKKREKSTKKEVTK